jgi:hypothetical protein
MPADAIWKQGDSAPVLKETFTRPNGTRYSLEGATVNLTIRALTADAPLTLTGSIAIPNAVEGEATYTPSTQDTRTPGEYMANWQVVFPDGSEMTFPTDGYLWVSIQQNLTSPGGQQLVGLPEVKAALYLPANDYERDEDLRGLIEDVQPLIEEHTGPILLQRYEELFDGGNDIIVLSHTPNYGHGTTPVLNILGVSEFRGPIEYPLAPAANPVYGSIYSYELDPRMGEITRRTAGGGTMAFYPGRNSIHVVYEAGQERVPRNVRRAVLEAVRWWYRTTMATGRGREAMADESMERQQPLVSLPYHVIAMLSPTRRHPSIA